MFAAKMSRVREKIGPLNSAASGAKRAVSCGCGRSGMRGVRVGTRASITSRSSIEGDANGAGNGLGGTDGGADGDGAEQQGCNGGNQGSRKLQLIRHFQSPFFRPLRLRVDVVFNSSRVPIPENREK
jgi:hypothetical protein